MQTIKIEYVGGNIEYLHDAFLVNAENDEATEYQIQTEEGVAHIPHSIVVRLTELV